MTSHPKTGNDAKSGAERRRWPRKDCDWPVTVTIGGVACEAKLRDVSRAGLCFYVERPIPLMTVLALALDLPGRGKPHKLRANGAVVRCAKISPAVQHYEVAVFLHDISESDRAALDLHVGVHASDRD